MRRRKAPGPKREVARGARRGDQSGRLISAEAIPDILSMQAVYAGGTRCVGFIYSRGRSGVEAFNRETESPGLYPNLKAAAGAVTRAAGGAS